MKLGTSSPLHHLNAEDWAKKHRSLGLEAVNFHLTCEDPPDKVDEFVTAAEAYGLTIAEVGIWRNTLDPDEELRRRNIRYAVGQLELADRIGAACCVNILGSTGRRWDGAYKENYSRETWDKGIRTIREIIDAVNPKNTWFTIESMPWMYPDGPDSYLELLQAVDRERFAVHLDLFNWIITPRRYFFNEDFADECFEKLGPLIRSCHLKDVLFEEAYTLHFQECSAGSGGINIRHLIHRAEKERPDMPFIIEHLDSDEAYLDSIQYVQTLMKRDE